jgi:hypothetical protein
MNTKITIEILGRQKLEYELNEALTSDLLKGGVVRFTFSAIESQALIAIGEIISAPTVEDLDKPLEC